MNISDNTEGIQILPLTENNVDDIICSPGGLEIKNVDLKGDLYKTVLWHKKMINKGMSGYIFYKGDTPYGFIEYMPVEPSPFPIEAPGSAVLMCFHWVATEDEPHLETEKEMIEMVIEDIYDNFDGLVTFGWNNPEHYPIEMLEELGFETVENLDQTSLMWLPLKKDAVEPTIMDTTLQVEDLSDEGKLKIVSTYSNRCPYSIYNGIKVKKTVKEIDDDRIEFTQHLIDSQDDALGWADNPGRWEYMIIDGEEIDIFHKPSDEIKEIIKEKLSEL
ncbi:MAG: hypothetical protein R6W73_06730 [Candidatus Saliniplasma sp.]